MKLKEDGEGTSLTRFFALLPKNVGWALTVLVLILGALLMFEGQGANRHDPSQWLYEIGFALVVSAVVSAIYEFHARVQFEDLVLTGVLRSVFDELVVKGVWDTIHKQIVDKHIFREEAFLKIQIPSPSPPECLPGNLWKLHVVFSYRLSAARHNLEKAFIRHQLNYHLREGDRLPRFERIVFGKHNMIEKDFEARVKDGVFSMPWDPAKDGNPIEISVERVELTNVPGSYYFTFLDLTCGVKIEVDELPESVEGEICALPETKTYKMVQNKVVELQNMFLPGQSIEFRFKLKGG